MVAAVSSPPPSANVSSQRGIISALVRGRDWGLGVTGVLLLLATRVALAPPPPGGGVRLVLPHTIYAVPGVETNIYFENTVLVLNSANYSFDVDCRKGAQQAERWTFVPTPEDVGDYRLSLRVNDESNAVIAKAEAVLRVVPADAGGDRDINVLFVGDSLTGAGVYSRHVLELCAAPGNPRLTLVGGRGDGQAGTNRHEGYGGWTAKRFAIEDGASMTSPESPVCSSPFLHLDRRGMPILDYARFCDQVNGGRTPDFVVFFLGTNDVFGAIDGNIDSRIDAMFPHLEALVGMILRVRPETQVGIVLIPPPARSQDAFGASYSCGQTRWQYRRNQHRLVERIATEFAGFEAANVHLVPVYLGLDCDLGYPFGPPTSLNSRAKERGSRQSNGVHPGEAGYRQIGDVVYSWLKARLAEIPGKTPSRGRNAGK